ncbi:NAD(P)/FAD-dependent oxidoreductase [Paenarthrobacter nitroguajacolicus]|uniref:NAD(P)/FAD-dependent oxidoreductase n=2 Tax=Paenarthrobacter nitroguajacolicus TaxID=211146 RepID=A0A558GNN4_PAENT|nr:NAD(P)/FAD-dependent oxidoreductase [Paenarthrobacter nitroguajacolicus]
MMNEHVDVLIVGAGISGIGMASSLSGEGLSISILESRHELGGTWSLFQYPGIRSDSDMTTFAFRSHPWVDERTIAPGETIQEYLRSVAEQAEVARLIRYRRRVIRADWSSEAQTWRVEYEELETGEVRSLTCWMLFGATGYYRYDEGYRPSWPTLPRFQGTVVHPQQWPSDLDVRDKRVVVVGSGATAVTLVPSLADAGAKVTMLQRSPTYIAAVPSRDTLGNRIRRFLPLRVAAGANRWRGILKGMFVYEFSRRRPARMRALLHEGVTRQLGPDYPVDRHFKPDYDPWDQRLCATPDGDLFDSIRNGQADVMTDHISAFTEDGIQLASGGHLQADIIVTATGLNILMFGDIEFRIDGELIDLASRVSYRGMMLDGVPNFAFAFGYTNSSWTLKVDLITDHVRRLLRTLRRTGALTVTPHYEGRRDNLPPLIDMGSGYVKRGVHLLPRQGDGSDWRRNQNYLSDHRLFRRKIRDQSALRFTNSSVRSA